MSLDPKKFDVASRELYRLEGIKAAARSLGDPQLGRRSILIGGTNGKGSVTQFVSALLIWAGRKVGSYMSPHVLEEGERIRVNGDISSEDYIKRLDHEVLKPLTYFEKFTLKAFLAFEREKLEFQVIEVGLGGRFDATNICDPEVSVICSVGLDHEDVLGKGLRSIAKDKSGIMRPGRPCFVPEDLEAEAATVIREEAARCGSKLQFVTLHQGLSELEPHEAMNWSLALEVFRALGFEESPSSSEIYQLHKKIKLPARQQVLNQSPLVIVDGAHNPAAMEKLVLFLARKYSDQKFNILFGVMDDKPAEEMLELLLPFAKSFQFPHFFDQRQLSPESLVLKAPKVVQKHCEIKDLAELDLKKDEAYLICGSFYLAGEFLKYWKSKFL